MVELEWVMAEAPKARVKLPKERKTREKHHRVRNNERPQKAMNPRRQ